MQIHLLCLLSPELDLDILPHWIKYYKEFNLDSYMVWLHSEGLERRTPNYIIAEEMLQDNGFKVLSSHGGFNSGDLKIDIFNSYKHWMNPNDYLLTVDSDEFQQWGTFDLHSLVEKDPVDFFTGRLLDCYADTLKPCTHEDLNEQYPIRARKLEQQINGDENPDPFQKWYDEKIVLNKVWVPVCYHGSHEIRHQLIPPEKKGAFRCKGEIDVLHFRWRATLEYRLLTKKWNNDSKIQNILKFFNSKGVQYYGSI